MSKFFVSAVVVAAAGSAAVWFGLPLLKSHSPESYSRLASAFSGSRASEIVRKADAAIGAGVEKVSSSELGAKAVSGAKAMARTAKTVASQTAETLSDAAQDLGLASGDGDAAGTGAGSPSAAAADSPETAGTAAASQDDAPDPRAAKNADPGLPWGVVATNSFCYDGSLHRLGTIPGATPVERVSSRTFPFGEIVECKVLKNLVWQERTVWFFDTDLICFDGVSYAETDRSQRDAILDYCAAWTRYETAKAANFARFKPLNPHEEAYKKAKAEHDALQNEISETMAKVRYSDRNELPGGPAERAALLKKANELRVKQKAEAARFAPVRDRWQAWEDEHDLDEDSVPESPAMREAKAEMDRLRPAAARLVPDL